MNLCEAPALKVEHLTVSYGKDPVLFDVTFSVPAGQLVAILGPNGAGKSTLFKALLGLVRPMSSSVEFLGQHYKKVRKLVAYVPQKSAVDWDYPVSVLDVVLMGSYARRGLFKWVRQEDRELAFHALKTVGLHLLASRQINELSGGQQQRVFLARALMQQAQVYLMDEPFAGVDAETEAVLMEVLKDLKRQGKTIFVVHHDLEAVEKHFDFVVLLHTRLIEAGPVSLVFHEDNIRTLFNKMAL